MEIELSRLTSCETVFEGDVCLPPDPPSGRGSLAAEGVRIPGPVRMEVTVRKLGEVVVVAGRVVGQVEIACCRCLAPVLRPVDIEFESRHHEVKAAPSREVTAEADDEDGACLTADELDVSFLPAGATHLDLAEVAREQVVLDLPYRMTCKPDCAGLCPRCGEDRNESACGCEGSGEDAIDPRLAALADVRRRLKGS